MSKKIKRLNNTPRKADASKEKRSEYISFCFKYLTDNDNFNFSYFSGKQKTEERDIKSNLYDRIEALSKLTWEQAALLPKNTGFETIPLDEIGFVPNDIVLSDEQKVYIFRFKGVNGHSCRMIGIKLPGERTVCYIIGYDFNYSAYDHGS